MNYSPSKVPQHYLPGFNALRFLAASTVVFHHLGRQAELNSIPLPTLPLFETAGPLGVQFFFTLSGFLITYLLGLEVRATGRIDAQAFYVRRILRIWPLYYFVLFLAYFGVPLIFGAISWRPPFIEKSLLNLHQTFPSSFLFSFFLMPNISLKVYGPIFLAGLLWSVGVEEQFYAVWPWILKWLSWPRAFVGLLLTKVFIVPWIARITGSAVFTFLAETRFELMIWGGMGAWLLLNYPRIVQFFFQNSLARWISPLLLFFALTRNLLFTGPAFVFVLLSLREGKLGPFLLENWWLKYLGNISYGIYLLHPPIILLALYLGQRFHSAVLVYVVAFFLTLLFAHLSYRYFERPFLKLKERWARVPGGYVPEPVPIAQTMRNVGYCEMTS